MGRWCAGATMIMGRRRRRGVRSPRFPPVGFLRVGCGLMGRWCAGATTRTVRRPRRLVPFTQIAVGPMYACGVRSDGSVVCWGDSDHGQTEAPGGTFTQIAVAHRVACGVRTDGSAVCWGNRWSGQTTPPPGPFTQIAVGPINACGLRTDGAVACWRGRLPNRGLGYSVLLPPADWAGPPQAETGQPTSAFVDVPAGHVSEAAIAWAAESGITVGVGNNRFGVGQTLTRYEMVTFLCRAFDPTNCTTGTEGSDRFADVPPGHWANYSVGWAVSQGVTTGVNATEFGGSQTLTREQMITFLYRAKGEPTGGSLGSDLYQDVPDNSSQWANRR